MGGSELQEGGCSIKPPQQPLLVRTSQFQRLHICFCVSVAIVTVSWLTANFETITGHYTRIPQQSSTPTDVSWTLGAQNRSVTATTSLPHLFSGSTPAFDHTLINPPDGSQFYPLFTCSVHLHLAGTSWGNFLAQELLNSIVMTSQWCCNNIFLIKH